MSQSKIEDIFFYRKKDFQENSINWIRPIFNKNFLKTKPEDLNSFWDNIKDLQVRAAEERGEKLKVEDFIVEQCSKLNSIPMKNVATELVFGKHLKIFDKEKPEVYALVDYRDSKNHELRGQILVNLLEECKQKEEFKDKKVYEVLTDLLGDHHHPSLMYPLNKIPVDDRARNLIFDTIDSIIADPNREMFEYVIKNQEEYNQTMATMAEKNETFLAAIDKNNIQNLKEKLGQDTFQQKQFSEPRAQAIEKLLNYRNTLFEETATQGINLKNKNKANKCHFSEELIQVLYTNEPQQGQNFKTYMQDCVQKAEANLTKAKSWQQGFQSRLVNIVRDLKKIEATQDVSKTVELKDIKEDTKTWQQGERKAKAEETRASTLGIARHNQQVLEKDFAQMTETLNKAQREIKTWQQSKRNPQKEGGPRVATSRHHRALDKDFDQMQKALKEAEAGFSNRGDSWKEGKVNKIKEMKHQLHDMVMGRKTKKEKAETEEEAPDKNSLKM